MNKTSLRILEIAVGLILTYLGIEIILEEQEKPEISNDEILFLRQLASVNDSRLAGILDESIVEIPAGNFIRGSNMGNYNESPQQTIYLDEFEIDRYEVTNIQYFRFLNATSGKAPSYWNGQNYPTGQAEYPVVGIAWKDANAYCEWINKRLPTEAEWEKACRGTDGRTYPWGNEWNPKLANVDIFSEASMTGEQPGSDSAWVYAWQLLRSTPGAGRLGLKPIGSYPAGASPYGVLDMVGNASEWVYDWYNWSDYSKMSTRNPINLEPLWNHCIRGSAWHDPTGNLNLVPAVSRCSARSSAHSSSATLDPRIGFRCAESIKAK